MKLNVPTFKPNERLARYIEPIDRQGKKRAKITAFMDAPEGKNDGLSVNSLEVHTENQIASIYELKFSDKRPLAMSTPTISEYNGAAESANTMLSYRESEGAWIYLGPRGPELGYIHDPRAANESHCLVSYTKDFDTLQRLRFAKRIAYQPTYKYY